MIRSFFLNSNHRSASLLEKLGQLWDQFIENTQQSIKNFLGIPHLGFVLSQVSGKLRKLKLCLLFTVSVASVLAVSTAKNDIYCLINPAKLLIHDPKP